jgi:hypothetical protein
MPESPQVINKRKQIKRWSRRSQLQVRTATQKKHSNKPGPTPPQPPLPPIHPPLAQAMTRNPDCISFDLQTENHGTRTYQESVTAMMTLKFRVIISIEEINLFISILDLELHH